MKIKDLKPGQELTYQQLCEIFDTKFYRGMNRRKTLNSLILISNHTKSFYEDEWKDNIFYYTGEGQTGDQKLNGQNKTIAESNENGVKVYLFEVHDPGVYFFQGLVRLESKPYQELQEDYKGNKRLVWIFPLKLIDQNQPNAIPDESFQKKEKIRQKNAAKLSNEELI